MVGIHRALRRAALEDLGRLRDRLHGLVFNRQKDWVDIAAMLEVGAALEVAEVLRWVGRIAGDDDPRYERVVAVLTRR